MQVESALEDNKLLIFFGRANTYSHIFIYTSTVETRDGQRDGGVDRDTGSGALSFFCHGQYLRLFTVFLLVFPSP